MLFAPNLVWRNEPISKRVQKLIDLPIIVENDANCHAWAESRFGAARGYRAVAAVILGTGIGGGMVLEGNLYRGGFGIAAEFGHFRAVPDGRLCGCGNRGCWEQYASGMALVREAREMARLAPISVPYLLKAVAGERSTPSPGHSSPRRQTPATRAPANASTPSAAGSVRVSPTWPRSSIRPVSSSAAARPTPARC